MFGHIQPDSRCSCGMEMTFTTNVEKARWSCGHDLIDVTTSADPAVRMFCKICKKTFI